jgi:hypothetical protein
LDIGLRLHKLFGINKSVDKFLAHSPRASKTPVRSPKSSFVIRGPACTILDAKNDPFAVLPTRELAANRTAMITAMFFVGGVLLIGGGVWLAVLFEQAPCGFQCDKHGYLHGKLNACPKCGVAIFRRGSGFSPQV